MSHLDPVVHHLLRRAGFGASQAEAASWNQLSMNAAVDRLVDYESVTEDVDQRIGSFGYLGTTSRGPFNPDNRITDARQRWLFRMVHSQRPLQEKMALFWHNHFATGFTKVAGQLGGPAASRAMASSMVGTGAPGRGQLELFRQHAVGSFRDLLLAVSQDPAMVVWLDGHKNVKESPQENYARELMELFTIGVGAHTESDVRAAARVFTGWSLRPQGTGREDRYATFFFDPRRHDSAPKTFSFAIYPDGRTTIPSRDTAAGFQDGVDLITALARHPATGPRLVEKLYRFFVNEVDPPDPGLVQQLTATYYATNFSVREVVRQLLRSSGFQDPRNYWPRHSWPAEFVVRLIKEVGWSGFTAAAALAPMANMGQILFEPPNVSGWATGPGWFSTGTMLARTNFAARLTENQRLALRTDALSSAQTPEALLNYFLDRLSLQPLAPEVRESFLGYLRAGVGSTDSAALVTTKASGLVHLLAGSGEYQFV